MVQFLKNCLVISLVSLCLTNLEARIFLPSFGNLTYVPLGSNVTISWSYDFNEDDVGHVEWRFIKKNGSSPEILAHNLKGSLKKKDSSLPDISLILPSTIILNNVTLSYNGTYRYVVTLLGVNPSSSEVVVIILEQPQAIINCPKSNVVEKGKNFSCLCSSSKGNPPPTASWCLENGTVIGETGYLKKKLLLENFSKAQSGTYRCKVQSHNLTDEENIIISLYTEPTANITCPTQTFVEEGKPFTCLCSGIGGNPTPNAYWVKQREITPKNRVGLWNRLAFNNIKKTDNGTYVCIVESLKFRDKKLMHIFVRSSTATPTTARTTNGSGTSAGGSKTFTTGVIAGIAAGGLVLVVLVVVLIIYCCCPGKCCCPGNCCKKEKNMDRYGGEVMEGNETNAAREENQYAIANESVPDENPNESGNSRPSTSGTLGAGPPSTLPPVYAVVDKSRVSKKNKEKKAEEDPTKVTYASLDAVALQPDSSKMRERPKVETNYASINMSKL